MDEGVHAMKVRVTCKRRSSKGFTTLDGFLAEEGTLENFEAVAIREILAWPLEKPMKDAGVVPFPMPFRISRHHLGRAPKPRGRGHPWSFRHGFTACLPLEALHCCRA